MSTTDEKKIKFLEYFKELPVQKLAAASIGMDEDSISRWKKEDKDFADRIEYAKAQWALKNVQGVKSKEWLLERLMSQDFGEKKNLKVEGELKVIPILGGATNTPKLEEGGDDAIPTDDSN